MLDREILDRLACLETLVAELQQVISDQGKTIEKQAKIIEDQSGTIKSQSIIIADVEESNRRLLRWRFGRRNEKVVDDGQTFIPLEGLTCDLEWDETQAGNAETAVKVRKKKRKRMLWSQLCPHLPIDVQHIELPEDQRFDVDGAPLVPHGCETREELLYQPGTLRIRRILRQRYGRSDTGDKKATAPNPKRIVEKGGLCDETILAMVIHHAMDCLPYHRIAEMLSRMGAPITRGIVTRSCNAFAKLALPLVDAMQQQIQAGDIVHIDGSFLFRQGKGRTRKCTRSPLYAITDGDQVAMRWRPDERHATAADLIPGYCGYLIRDEWQGWQKLNDVEVTHIGCNAHARRYFAQTMDHDGDSRRIVDIYSRIYAIERMATDSGLTGAALFDHRQVLRQRHSVELMDQLIAEAKRLAAVRSGDFRTKVNYIIDHAPELRRFLDNGALPVDNNLAERVLRRNAMLRKNRMFFVAQDAGQHIGTMLSLMGSCRLLDLNPLDYLTWALSALLDHRDAPEGNKPDLGLWTPLAYSKLLAADTQTAA